MNELQKPSPLIALTPHNYESRNLIRLFLCQFSISKTISLTDKMTFYVLSSSTDTRDDYSVGFLIDNSLIGYMIFNMGWVHVRYEVDTTGVRTYIKYGSNEWWRFS